MQNRIRLAAIAVSALTATTTMGCGSDDEVDLLGFWQVTAHTVNTTGCGAEGPAVTDPAYIKFSEQSALGITFIQVQPCTAATDASCGTAVANRLYTESITNGQRAEAHTANTASGGRCILAHIVSDAVVRSGALRIETRVNTETRTSTSCTLEDAEAATLPCASYEVLVASRP